MKTVLFVLGILCSAGRLHAQSTNIGDTFHFSTSTLYRQGAPAPFTSKGQPLLLVFINPSCGSCDAQLRLLDSLGPNLPPSLRIVAVSKWAYPELKNKLLTPSLAQSPYLSYLTDTLLRKQFPYRLVPHNVWVNAQGRISAITGLADVKLSTLQAFCQGKNIRLPLKKDLLHFKYEQPYTQQEELMDKQVPLVSSSLLPYIDGLGGAVGRHLLFDKKIRRIYLINVSRKELYKYAMPGSTDKILEIHLKDTLAFDPPEDIHQYTYCYELLVPASASKQEISRLMLEDLDRLFGYERQEKADGNRIILTDRR